MQAVLRHRHIGRHGPVPVNAQAAGLGTQLGQSHFAGRAVAAGIEVGLDRNTIPRSDSSLASLHQFHHAYQLVAHNKRGRTGEFTMVDVEIHAAHGAGIYPHQHVVHSIQNRFGPVLKTYVS